MAKKKKVRVDLRKNRSKPPRRKGWTRSFRADDQGDDATPTQERVRAKGDLSRRRTIIQDEPAAGQAPGPEPAAMPAADLSTCVPGRVLRVQGLLSVVQADDGRQFRCAVRRLLKTLPTDQRNIVAPGDRVWIRPSLGDEGFIERVEPRHGPLTRASRGREHILVANVDQVVIVMALVQSELKPPLIDRY